MRRLFLCIQLDSDDEDDDVDCTSTLHKILEGVSNEGPVGLGVSCSPAAACPHVRSCC